MQQNNGLKFSRDRKSYIDFQLDVFGGGRWGYFENVQWTLCVKESICVRPLTPLSECKAGGHFTSRREEGTSFAALFARVGLPVLVSSTIGYVDNNASKQILSLP